LGDDNLTLVYVHVQEDSVRFRTITSPRTTIQWDVADQWSITNTKRFALQYVEPQPGYEISGTNNINWSVPMQTDSSLNIKIYVSNNGGARWDLLWSEQTQDTTYAWNTINNPDGTRYMLLIVAQDDSGFGMAHSTGTFVLNNPGNATPELILNSPKGTENIKNTFEIEWEAKDADSDVLSISLEYSINSGVVWNTIAENLENTGSYLWDTNLVPNSSNYVVKVICADDSVFVSESSKIFSILNDRVEIPNANFLHIEGHGGGNAYGYAFDPGQLTGHVYSITFNDSIPGQKTYNVFDKQTAKFVLENVTEMDGVTEGPSFDGMRLIIFDYKVTEKDEANSGWVNENVNFKHTISLPVLGVGNEVIKGFPYPANYKITIADQVVDTSSTYLNLPATPMMFDVYNITEDYQVDILYIENDTDHQIGPLDQIYILEKDEQGDPMMTWRIAFSNVDSAVLPIPGDEFILATLKPFTNEDVFEFKSVLTELEDEIVHTPFTFGLSQNYPNPFNPTTTISYQLPSISKINLSIYNILGQKLTTLVAEKQPAGSYKAVWDASGIASGVYFYRLETQQGLVETRKLVLLK